MPGKDAVKRLLVVEDSETILLLIRMRLEMAGYEVTAATNGRQALDRLEEARPDLILLDLRMPVMSGVEVLNELRARGDPTPVLVCTAHRDPAEMVDATEAGADDHITKPIDFDVLFEKIERLTAGASA